MNTSKPPEGVDLLTTKAILAPDVAKILKKHHAPAHWDDAETMLLLEWLFFPRTTDAINVTKLGDGKSACQIPGLEATSGTISFPTKMANALMFAKMFAEGQETLIEALPKILILLNKYCASPMRKLIIEQTSANEVAKLMKQPAPKVFWESKASSLAPKDGTAKTVEHARNFLREKASQKSKIK